MGTINLHHLSLMELIELWKFYIQAIDRYSDQKEITEGRKISDKIFSIIHFKIISNKENKI